MLHNLFIDDFIHDLEPLDRLLLRDSNELLLQWHGTEAVVKEEESLRGLYTQECGYIFVVRQGGTQPYQPNILLGRLYVPYGSAEGDSESALLLSGI